MKKRNPTLEDVVVAVVEFILLGLFVWGGWDLFAIPVRGLPLLSPIQAFGLEAAIGAVSILVGEVFNS